MSNETRKKKSERTIDDLKKLSQTMSSDKFSHLLKELTGAKKTLETLYQNVNAKKQKLTAENEKNAIQAEAKKEFQSSKVGASKEKNYSNKNGNFSKTATYKNNDKSNFSNKSKDRNNFSKTNTNSLNKKPYNKGAKSFEVASEPVTTSDKVRNKFAHSQPSKKASDYDKKSKTLNKKQLLKRNLIKNRASDDRYITRKPKKQKKQKTIITTKVIDHAVITTDNLTVKVLAETIGKPVSEIVKKLFLLGIMATINSVIDFDTADLVAGELGITLEKRVEKTMEEKLTDIIEQTNDDEKELVKRAPIVTVMGHVDHGKTSLLDCIRKTNVTSGEAGGITQNIGAYTVKTEKGEITFIDTPGHAAFTEMRARGAKVTDVAILVVAADDGIMPQTVEAINHIKAADVPMIVAINKIDKPQSNIEKVKQQLADNNVLSEDWGGDTVMVPVSAHTKEGIDKLLEMIVLVAEMKELKANPTRAGVGSVIEAKLDKGRGPVATIIVQNGTLKVGDSIVAGVSSGRIRAMVDDKGKEVKEAFPSTPVAVIGFDSVPEAGSIATVVDDKMVKDLVNERIEKQKQERLKTSKMVNLDDLFSKVKNENLKTLNVIVKAGVSGIVEALKQSIEKIKNEEVNVHIVHGGTGAITENDVLLAQTTNSIIIGFNVRPDANAKRLAEREKVDIRFYNVIYNVIDELNAAIKGMLAPKFEEKVIGHAEVKVLYKISKVGTVSGCMVKDGVIKRNASIRVLRDNVVVADTAIDTLRIQKEDVKEVKTNFECGIKLVNFNDLKENDVFEAYVEEEIKR